MCRYIRPKINADHEIVVDVFKDSINSLCRNLYSKEQIKVWLSLTTIDGAMDRASINGNGWVSWLDSEIEAFAIRYSTDRLHCFIAEVDLLDKVMLKSF